jgi:DNA-binding PadR family transcriptional regulator
LENVDKTLLNLAMDGLVTSRRRAGVEGDRIVALTAEGRTLAVRPLRTRSSFGA